MSLGELIELSRKNDEYEARITELAGIVESKDREISRLEQKLLTEASGSGSKFLLAQNLELREQRAALTERVAAAEIKLRDQTARIAELESEREMALHAHNETVNKLCASVKLQAERITELELTISNGVKSTAELLNEASKDVPELTERIAELREVLSWVWNEGVCSGELKDSVRKALWPKTHGEVKP